MRGKLLALSRSQSFPKFERLTNVRWFMLVRSSECENGGDKRSMKRERKQSITDVTVFNYGPSERKRNVSEVKC